MSGRHINVSQFLENLNTIDDSLDYGSNSNSPAGHAGHTDRSVESITANVGAGPNSRSGLGNNDNNASSHGLGGSSSNNGEEELAIFANTQFFDFDMGCSTDISATMDDLLMQQEQQLQCSKVAFNNGASSSSAASSSSSASSSLLSSLSSSSAPLQSSFNFQQQASTDLTFDLGNLQQFSLANELLPLSTNSPTSSSNSSGNVPTSNSQQVSFSSSSANYLQHQFTDPLTLSTQPRLSHLVASPALNSMINHQQQNSHSQFHHLQSQLHQTPFIQNQQQPRNKSLISSPQVSPKLAQPSSPVGSTVSPSPVSHSTTPTSVSSSCSPVANNNAITSTTSTAVSPARFQIPAPTSTPSIPEKPVRKDETIAVPPPNSKRRRTGISSSVSVASTVEKTASTLSKARAVSVEEVAAVAASSDSPEAEETDGKNLTPEEDKRRRNTAASARFRVKKKLREQQMERTAKELQERVHSLETKIMQLEMENKWLRNLVVEKNEARDMTELFDMKKKIMSESTLSKVNAKVK